MQDCPAWHFLPGPYQADEDRTLCPRRAEHARMRERYEQEYDGPLTQAGGDGTYADNH